MNFFRRKNYDKAPKENESSSYTVYDSSGNAVKEIKLEEGQEVKNIERVVTDKEVEKEVKIDEAKVENSLSESLKVHVSIEVTEVVDPTQEDRSEKGADRSNIKTKEGFGGGSLMTPHGRGKPFVGEYVKNTPEMIQEIAKQVAQNSSEIVKNNEKSEVVVVEIVQNDEKKPVVANLNKLLATVGLGALALSMLTNIQGCSNQLEKEDIPDNPEIIEDDIIDEEEKERIVESQIKQIKRRNR